MRLKGLEQERTEVVVFGKCIEQFDRGEDGPAVGAGPEHAGMERHRLNPSVAEKFLLGDEHLLYEKTVLFACLVKVFFVAGQCPHLCHGRKAHEHVVKPDGILYGPVAGQRAVLQAVLSVHNPRHVVVNNRLETAGGPFWHFGNWLARHIGHVGGPVPHIRSVSSHVRTGHEASLPHSFQHGAAHCAAVVQCTGLKHFLELAVPARTVFHSVLEMGGNIGKESQAVQRVVGKAPVAGHFAGRQHGNICDAPLVACQAEQPLLKT